MATEAKLRQLADKGCPVYYFYSTERYLVRQGQEFQPAAVQEMGDPMVKDGVHAGIEQKNLQAAAGRRVAGLIRPHVHNYKTNHIKF